MMEGLCKLSHKKQRRLSKTFYMRLEVSDCDILRLSRFWNITYHDCENNHDYKILTIFDEKTTHV